MLNKIIGLTALALIYSINVYAQEAVVLAEEELSSDEKLQRDTIAHKNVIVKDVNNRVYKANDAELREFVRNSEAMKKIMDREPHEEKIDIKDKAAVSKYMQREIGLPDKIVVSTQTAETKDKAYKSKASQDLK